MKGCDDIEWLHLTLSFLPINGLDDVMGIISETVFRKIVRESSIVTPKNI